MTYEAPNRPAFTTETRARRFPIDELDTVTLAVDTRTDDGETVPAGTVVAVWGESEAFDVEFDPPVTGLATVDRGMISGGERIG